VNRTAAHQLIAKCLSLDWFPERAPDVAAALSSAEFDWPLFITTGSNHLVLQTMFRIFRDRDLLDQLPPEAEQELEKIYTLVKERNQLLINTARELNTMLSANNIKPVFLKGAGNLLGGLYHDTGDRLMVDIDLMVPFDQIIPAAELIKNSGYVQHREFDQEKIPKLKHYPRLYRDDSPVQLELHWQPVGYQYRKKFNAKVVMPDVINPEKYPDCRILSWKHALQHNFIHSQLEHRAHTYARVYLRNLYDLRLLSAKTDPEAALSQLDYHPRKAATYLQLMHRTFSIQEVKQSHFTRRYHRFFFFRHMLNLRINSITVIQQLLAKIFRSYVKKPIWSFTDAKLRRKLLKNLITPGWFKTHLQSYRKLFKKPEA